MAETKPGRRCSRIAACDSFLMFGLRNSLALWARSYCEGNFEQCARYRAALSCRDIPENLLPNGRELNSTLL